MLLSGVDVGGTFTDVVVYDEDLQTVRVGKVRSSHPTPDVAVLGGLETIGGEDAIRRISYFVHGTTVGLNALIEGRGNRLAMFATRGLRDVLEIRRSNQVEDPYNLFWRAAAPLIPRALRFPITERVSADGSVLVEMNPRDVERSVRAAIDASVDGIVVAFINAYANGDHEREVERIARSLGYQGDITLSHRVSGEYREYERTSTAVVNGFIRPYVSAYLERVSTGLAERGFGGTSLVTRSGGGAMGFADAGDRPFETLLSGPVAGVEGAAFLARKLGHRQLITADVGGTSFDTALIIDGRPVVDRVGEIAGLPLQSPWVDVRSIGAGGGSIAHIDAGGLLRVGPRSAGANPGPASYGSGGIEPTVTDAAVALGMFPVRDLSDDVQLDLGLASSALRPLADQLGLAVDGVAAGIIRIAASKMANAIREITIEQGEDTRTAVLAPFGGAGPLFGTLLADELEIAEIIVPPFAGVFSAWGLLVSDAVQVRAATRLLPLSAESLNVVEELLTQLHGEIEQSAAVEDPSRPTLRTASLDLRYSGQEHHLTLNVAIAGGHLTVDAGDIRDDFVQQYQRTFGIALPADVEIVAIRAEIRRPLQNEATISTASAPDSGDSSAEAANARIYSFEQDGWAEFCVITRSSLLPGDRVPGPMVITEPTTSIYVDAGFTAAVGETGSIHLTRRALA